MELVEGEDLAQRIKRGPIPSAEAWPIARQIAEALEAAHEQSIVHRDLKPANIKVRDDGTVKVLDFGLAKALDPPAPSSAEAMNSPTLTGPATQLGMILGTAAYMAPEQAKGRPVDKRADIWAFGVVLYEMLSGRRGYDAQDVSDTLAAVLTRDVDWTALPESTPPRIRALLLECLVRDPKQRLRDIGTARIELLKVERGTADESTLASSTPAPPRVRSVTIPWAVAGVAAVVAAIAAIWALRGPAPTPSLPVTRARVEFKDRAQFVAISRDGSRLAYDNRASSREGLVLRMLDQFDGHPIPVDELAAFPFFSPDGQWIGYTILTGLNSSKLKKVAVTGGVSTVLCDGYSIYGAAWGDDDTIVFSGPKGLMRVSAAGGTPQALTTVDTAKGETAHQWPQFLPGGHRILFSVVSGKSIEFAVLDLDSDRYRVVARGGVSGRYVSSGHLIYARGDTIFAVPFDVNHLAVEGAEEPVIEGVSSLGPTSGFADYAVSDNGVLVYIESTATGGGDTTLAWADRKGTTTALPGQQGPGGSRRGSLALSPDGLHVAHSISSGADESDIWVLDQRGALTRLTFGGANRSPVWTPDGLEVVYGSEQAGKFGIYEVKADGSGQPELFAVRVPAIAQVELAGPHCAQRRQRIHASRGRR